MAKQDSPEKRNAQRKVQISGGWWIWWLLSIALLVWSFFNLMTARPSNLAAIPYSTFLDQVRSDNVPRVHITGSTITGDLTKPLRWPPAAANGATKSPNTERTNNQAAPGTSAAHPGSANLSPSRRYRQFRTVFPATVGDPGLMALLGAHSVTVDVSAPSRPWLLDVLLIEWFPMLLLIGFFWWMAVGARRGQAGMFSFGRMKARHFSINQPKVTFRDVAGAAEAKADLQEEVDFLRNPQKYHDIGARIPRGVLLVGPPGAGKTLLARAMAGEAGVQFFSINASEFVEMFVGVGASRVRDLFRQAKEAAPAIIFIDELDAVGRRRGAGVGMGSDEREQTLNQLLGELDGFDPRVNVIILAATNRPDVLDPALMRPGRFDRQVVVRLPDRNGREGILKIHTRGLRLAGDVNLSVLAKMTIGLSGADLANLCNEAALAAARRNRSAIAVADFEDAYDGR